MKSSDNLPQRESKTQRKNQMIALQKIGETLVNLPAAQLEKIPLDPLLADAVSVARSLTTREAKRRQLQYIGRLMRDVDPLPIQTALEKIQLKDRQGTAQFHQIEQWRDKLIASEDDTLLQNFLQKFPHATRQELRQLIRQAQQNKTGAETQLFRYLKQIIEV